MKIFETKAALAAATLTAGQIVETKGYTTAGDGGGARYLIQTAAEFGGTPDEYGDHTLANGNVAVLQPDNGVVNIRQFGAAVDGVTNDSISIQKAVLSTGNAVTSANTVDLTAGQILITKPILINEKDGLVIKGRGKWATKIILSGAMTPDISQDPSFPADNHFRNYTYTDQPSAFIVSSRRVTGGAGGAFNPSGADAAAWHLQFEGFTIYGDILNPYDVNGFYVPNFGNGSFRDIDFQYVNAAWKANDFYRTKIDNCNIFNCFTPILHFATAGSVAQGTTLGISNTGCSRVSQGWKLNNINYSSWNNVSCDDWGWNQVDVNTKYAYQFENCDGIILNGCGAEINSTDSNMAVMSVDAGSSITLDCCFILATMSAASTELITLTGNTVIQNSAISINADAGATPANIVVRGGTQIFKNTYGASIASDMIQVIAGDLVFETPNMKPDIFVEAGAGVVVSGLATYEAVAHSNSLKNDQSINTVGGTVYTCKQKGKYKLDWHYIVSPVGSGRWVGSRVTVGGVAVDELVYVSAADTQSGAHTLWLDLDDGDVVAWEGKGTGGNVSVDRSTVYVERVA